MSCPAQDGRLSKSIKYYILCLAYARSGGDALREWEHHIEEMTGCFHDVKFIHTNKIPKKDDEKEEIIFVYIKVATFNWDPDPVFKIEVFNALQTRFGPSKYTSLNVTLQNATPN